MPVSIRISGLNTPPTSGSLRFTGQHRETYSDESRVERLLQGFTGETLQKPNLEYAINHIKDNPRYRTDYSAAVAYMATKIQEAYGNTTSTTRTVSEATQDRDVTGDHGYYGRGGYRGRGGGRHGRGGGRGNYLGRGNSLSSEQRSKFNGRTEYPEINGFKTDDSVVQGNFSAEAFDDHLLRYYVVSRRDFLKNSNNGGGSHSRELTSQQIKAIAMEVAKAQSGKRPGDDTNETRDDKKQKGGEQNGWKFMGKDAER